jgi:hypothetical protein
MNENDAAIVGADIDRAFTAYLQAIEEVYGFEITGMRIERDKTGRMANASITWQQKSTAEKKAQP